MSSSSLFATDLHVDVTEADLYELFNAVVSVASVRVCRDSRTKESLGHAYVNFHSYEDADKALKTLNYSVIKDSSTRLMWCQRDPAQRRSAANNLYVKGIPESFDHKQLHELFAPLGMILSCKVAKDRNGRSRGFGFVQYETKESAEGALASLQNIEIGDSVLSVAPFKTKQEREVIRDARFTNLYVKNFPQEWDSARLEEVFAPFGEVTSFAMKESHTGLKFAFVNFAENSEAKAAIADLHDKDVEGVALYVQPMQTRYQRQRTLREEFHRGKGIEGNLYVKNLEGDIFDDELRQLFEPFGEVTSAKVMVSGSHSRGFGFVSFKNAEDAQQALEELHKKVLVDKPLYVALAERKDQRIARLKSRFRPSSSSMAPQGYTWPPYPNAIEQPAVDLQKVRSTLNLAPPTQQKQIIGEALYPVVMKAEPQLAGKITGMLLEMTFEELDALMASKSRLLNKVEEAKRVLVHSRQ